MAASGRWRWGRYGQVLDTLERELQGVSDTFAGLSDDEWRMDTLLEPFEPDRPRWTVFELAGHFDISIGLTRMLIASQEDGQPGRDQVSFFIFPRSEVAPVVYDYAYTMVEGKTPGRHAGGARRDVRQVDLGVAGHCRPRPSVPATTR